MDYLLTAPSPQLTCISFYSGWLRINLSGDGVFCLWAGRNFTGISYLCCLCPNKELTASSFCFVLGRKDWKSFYYTSLYLFWFIFTARLRFVWHSWRTAVGAIYFWHAVPLGKQMGTEVFLWISFFFS